MIDAFLDHGKKLKDAPSELRGLACDAAEDLAPDVFVVALRKGLAVAAESHA